MDPGHKYTLTRGWDADPRNRLVSGHKHSWDLKDISGASPILDSGNKLKTYISWLSSAWPKLVSVALTHCSSPATELPKHKCQKKFYDMGHLTKSSSAFKCSVWELESSRVEITLCSWRGPEFNPRPLSDSSYNPSSITQAPGHLSFPSDIHWQLFSCTHINTHVHTCIHIYIRAHICVYMIF